MIVEPSHGEVEALPVWKQSVELEAVFQELIISSFVEKGKCATDENVHRPTKIGANATPSLSHRACTFGSETRLGNSTGRLDERGDQYHDWRQHKKAAPASDDTMTSTTGSEHDTLEFTTAQLAEWASFGPNPNKGKTPSSPEELAAAKQCKEQRMAMKRRLAAEIDNPQIWSLKKIGMELDRLVAEQGETESTIEARQHLHLQPTSELPASMSSPETALKDFHRQGYLVLPNVLDTDLVAQLRTAIDQQAGGTRQTPKKKQRHVMFKRVFEQHPELCLKAFKNETVLPIVRRLLGCCGSARGRDDSCLEAHVIHNNAFRIGPGMKGQAATWHTDDAPIFQTADGKPLPESVQIAPLVLTCMFFLSDLKSPKDGGTRVISGSHRFGTYCTDEAASKHQHLYTQCPAGSVLIISAHTWHRGAAVEDGATGPRYVFQGTYGRRLVGHKHGSIMNYELPKKVEKILKTEEDKKLMGFLQGGAYS